jgi:hypothetical protein
MTKQRHRLPASTAIVVVMQLAVSTYAARCITRLRQGAKEHFVTVLPRTNQKDYFKSFTIKVENNWILKKAQSFAGDKPPLEV